IAWFKPGQLLEYASMGIVGTIAWREMPQPRSAPRVLLAATCLLLPLSNTWPVRIYQNVIDGLPPPLPAVLSLGSLSAFALVIVVIVARQRQFSISPFLAVAWCFIAIGALAGSVNSAQPLVSAGDSWLAFLAPVVFGTAVAIMTSDQG